MIICDKKLCTGCGMCTNICPKDAIKMEKAENGFVFPFVEEDKCIRCGLCTKNCPANNYVENTIGVKNTYAAWNKNKSIRKNSTSGGIFSLLAEKILSEGGAVIGVVWNDSFSAEHCIIEKTEDIHSLYGSKYVQSNTKDIYIKTKHLLECGRKVLFSGTPCQNHALRLFLNKEYDNLYQIDLVCHGVPSQEMLDKYILERIGNDNKSVTDIRLRYKSPHWDYCNVRIDFDDGSVYSVPTVKDEYYILFNFAFSLRNSCHYCKYTNLNRMSDITLMDYWNFKPQNFKMSNFNFGVSGILINSSKGQKIFEKISPDLVYETASLEHVIRGNKCLKEPFNPDEKIVDAFWQDYNNGMSVIELCNKYVKNPYKIPKLIGLRRIKRKYGWILNK